QDFQLGSAESNLRPLGVRKCCSVLYRKLDRLGSDRVRAWNNAEQRQNEAPMEATYIAAKTRSSRPGWSVIFRHPLRRDARGKPGLKVRRGLNTAVDHEADALVAELNTLLADRTWWSADRRADAERLFQSQIVSAFFDGIEVGSSDSVQLR